MDNIRTYFQEAETEKKYDRCYYQIVDIVSIVVIGSLHWLKNISQLHQWLQNERMREFLRKKSEIERIPYYYWLLCLLDRCLLKWAELLPEDRKGVRVALDGKTIRSTGKMSSYDSLLHIVSAQLCETGITLASKSADRTSNETPALHELLKGLDISGL